MTDAPVLDDYAWWSAALDGITAPITESNPQPGFYRWRSNRGGPWLPVAIFRDEAGVTQCLVGADYEPVPPELIGARWLTVARFPVSEEAYRHAVDHDNAWPGVAESAPEGGARDDGPAPIGDNQPPEPVDPLPAQIEEEVAKVRGWLDGRSIASEGDAARCEAFVNRLRELAKAADERRDQEGRPHLEAKRQVDARWKPIIEAAKDAAASVRNALAPYLAAREAERRQAAAAAIAKGATEGARIDTRASTPGTTGGRKVSLRTIKSAEVQDWRAAALFFGDHPDVRAVVQKLTDKLVAVGADIPRPAVKALATDVAAAETPVFTVRTEQVAR